MLRILKSEAFVSLGGYVVQLTLTFATGVMIARVLGPGDYGILNILRNLYGTIANVAPLGLDVALLKYCGSAPRGDPKTEATVVRLRVLAGGVNLSIVASVWALSGWIQHQFYPYPHFDRFLMVTMLALPVQTDLSIRSALYKSRGEASFYNAFAYYFQSLSRLCMVVIAVMVLPTIQAMIVVNVLQMVFSALGLYIFERRRKWRAAPVAPTPPLRDADGSWSDVWPILSVSLWMTVSGFIIGLGRSADTLVLGGGYVSVQEVGAYAALTVVSQLVQIFPMAASQSLGPNVSRHYHAGDMPAVRRVLDDYLYLSTIVSGFVFAGIAVFGERLHLVFGHGFEFRPLVCFLLPLGYLLSAALSPMGYALSMTGRHKGEFAILAIGAVVLVLFCWLLIPSFGQTGAASAMVLGFTATNLLRFAYVSRVLGFIPGRLKDFWPIFVALAAAYLGKLLGDRIGEVTLATTVAGCVAYALIYAVAAYLFLLRPETRSLFGADAIGKFWKRRLAGSP
jgi:O-antigen/teichoic acid export membrane protein